MSYSLIIPIYNEKKTLRKLFEELNDVDNKIEIVLIDDGSNDGTKNYLKQQTSFKVIYNSENMGKGFSVIKGAKYAKNENIILMDGDLEINLKSVLKLITNSKINENNVLIGSRWKTGNKIQRNIHTYGNMFINYLFNILYQTNISDVLCCVKIMNRNLFNSLNLTSSGFNIEMEIMTKLALKNIEFHEEEVEYTRRNNNDGKKIKNSDGWGILWVMFTNRFF